MFDDLMEHIVDAVLSDVVLPGELSGPALAELVRSDNIDIPFVFMSGYPANAARATSLLQPENTLLNKPFRKQDLAIALHDALNG